MARVLAISSQVVRGHVGLSAIAPALLRLGHEVWPIPTVLLSNHPGHAHSSGMPVAAEIAADIIDALDKNGWLAEADAVITGYLPSIGHVDFAALLVNRLRARRPILFLCDPVLGDQPRGLYIDARAAAATRDELVPLADALTPNLFELAWLTGLPFDRLADAASLERAARLLSAPAILVTSAPAASGKLANVLVEPERCAVCEVETRDGVPHGTGDFLSALFLGHLLNGESRSAAAGRAVAGVKAAIEASTGCNELALAVSQRAWADAAPLPFRARS